MRKSKVIFAIIIISIFLGNVLIAQSYRGAEYRTKDLFLYGRFEVRYKPAQREGVVSSFFTYHDFDNTTGWNEIDFEFIGRYSNSIQFNTITPGQKFHIRTQHIDFNAYADFHDYAFEWTPDYVAWFIDGEEVFRQTGEHISTLQYASSIMMNIWNPVYTNWVGNFNNLTLPCVSIYDYVKYSAYTPGSGNYGTDNNFTLEWSDDFDSFDTERWSAPSHTFPGNMATFDPENVVFKDGFMHLYLTNETDKAGVDNQKPFILWARANYDSTISIRLSEEITKESAENVGNYTLPGGTILKSTLDESSLFVNLTTTNYNPFILNNLIYSGLVDTSTNANTSTTQVKIVNKVDSISYPIKINVGGDAYADYLPDQLWSNETAYGYWMGDKRSTALEITGTDDDDVFRSTRKGLITYKFILPNGLYNLKLQFSDNNNNNAGEGIFNVHAENLMVGKSIDLISLAGKYSAYEIESEVEVLDGVLDIYFEEEIDSAFVNGIIVNRIITDINYNEEIPVQSKFNLNQNYPNPFNPTTTIKYSIADMGTNQLVPIQLKVYDVLGTEVAVLVSDHKKAGNYSYKFDASKYPSGIYFYQLLANGSNVITKKMVIIK